MNLSGILVLMLAASTSAFSLHLSSPLGRSERNTRLVAVASGVPATKQRAIIVGGGPAGALLALYLARCRLEVDLFEAMDEDDVAGPSARSWNVVIMGRGLEAIQDGGVHLGDEAVDLEGTVRHHKKQKLGKTFFPGAKSICRGELTNTFLTKAKKTPNIKVHFGCTFSTTDMERRVATFERANGESVESQYDILVGADGVNSRVRLALQETIPDFTVRQVQSPQAFKTIVIPVMGMPDAEESWKTRVHAHHIKVGKFVASPRPDGTVTATIVLPSEGKDSFGALMKTTKDVRAFFSDHYPSAFGPDGPSEEVAKDFLERRSQRGRSLYCSKLAHGRIVLIGDAAHAMSASLGQGVNAALEDCRILAQVLESQQAESEPVDVPTALSTYNELRLSDVHAVCAMSEKGVEMTPAFAAQLMVTTLLNKTLGKLAPKIFKEPYLMDMNNAKIPYGEVLRGNKRQAAIAKAVFVGIALAFVGAARKALVKV